MTPTAEHARQSNGKPANSHMAKLIHKKHGILAISNNPKHDNQTHKRTDKPNGQTKRTRVPAEWTFVRFLQGRPATTITTNKTKRTNNHSIGSLYLCKGLQKVAFSDINLLQRTHRQPTINPATPCATSVRPQPRHSTNITSPEHQLRRHHPR